jgi:hypothetical protein
MSVERGEITNHLSFQQQNDKEKQGSKYGLYIPTHRDPHVYFPPPLRSLDPGLSGRGAGSEVFKTGEAGGEVFHQNLGADIKPACSRQVRDYIFLFTLKNLCLS